MNLADNLKKIRKDNNLSQEQLAEKLGVSRQSVSKWESGLSYPEMDKVLQICQLFNLNINELINEDIKEVNELKEAQVRTNKYVTSFFDYITKVVDMFSSMKFKEKIKCLFEQGVIAIVLIIIFFIIGMIGSEIIWSLLQFLPDKVYYPIYNIFSSIYLVIAIIIGVVVLLHIFKIRYLDYYEIVKEEVDTSVEEHVTEVEAKEVEDNNDKKNKIILEKKKEKIVIRDPKHSEYKFLTGLGRVCLWFVKAIVACVLCGFVLSLIAFVLCIPIVFLIIKSGFLFMGLLVGLLGLIGLNIIVLELLYNFIVNRKLCKTRTFIISIVSIILFGLGIGMSVMSLNSFEYLENSVELVKDTYKIDMNDKLYLSFYNNVSYVEKDIDNIEIEIEHSKYYDVKFYKYGNSVEYLTYSNFKDTMSFIKTIIKDINNKEIVTYNSDIRVIVYANKENIIKLQYNRKNRDDEIKNYERIIENQNTDYRELSNKYNDLIDYIEDNGYYITFDSNENVIISKEIGE